MNLLDIIENIESVKTEGNCDIEISDIFYDSRKVTKNGLFVCLCGSDFDGHDYINDAIKNGAVAVAVQKPLKISGVTVIETKNTREFLAYACASFFNHPAKELTTVAITGTKGKTTTSFMIRSIMESAGIKTGIIGTIGAVIGDKVSKLNNTTPESYEIQKNFRNMVNEGCKCVVVEASSLGLKNHRLDGFQFNYGIFTNFSNDHIGTNEHKSLDEYIKCKSMLFQKCNTGFINIDDNKSSEVIKNHTCEIKTFGINNTSDYHAENIKLVNNLGSIGVTFDLNGKLDINNVYVPIPGKFNVYNALAAAAVCSYMGIDNKSIVKGLAEVKVKGRVEPVKVSDDYSLFIDYAHNALSMENILTTLKQYNPERLIVLFGAGGNRPKARRYEMGETAGNLADLSVITSDNPRFENPKQILEDIKEGINKTNGKYIVIENRKEAIRYCLNNAKRGDIIVLAGKGHEDYQEVNGIKYPFDERVIIGNILNKKCN